MPRKKPAKLKPQSAAFESIQPTQSRTPIIMPGYSAQREAPSLDRRALLLAGRWAVNNVGIAARLVRGSTRYALGTGLVPQASSGDPDYDARVEAWFDERYGYMPWAFDVSGSVNFYSAQISLCESMMIDGDVFVRLVRSQKGLPMAQLIPGSHVGDGLKPPKGMVDGIQLNEQGKPLYYRILQDPDNPKSPYEDVPADEILHIRRIHRVGYARGISWLGIGVDRMQDIREMFLRQLANARLQSSVGLIIESDGSLSLGPVKESEGRKIEEIGGGVGVVKLQRGEKLSAHTFDQPGPNLLAFDKHQTREIAYGFGVSPEVLLDLGSLGGPAVRAALQDAQIFFASIRDIIETNFCVRFWRYAVWHAIKSGELTPPKNGAWHKVSFIGPPSLTIDKARDAKSMIDLIDSGLMSRRKYFSEQGLSYDDTIREIARDAARAKKIIQEEAAKEGVSLTYEEIFRPQPGSARSTSKESLDTEEET